MCIPLASATHEGGTLTSLRGSGHNAEGVTNINEICHLVLVSGAGSGSDALAHNIGCMLLPWQSSWSPTHNKTTPPKSSLQQLLKNQTGAFACETTARHLGELLITLVPGFGFLPWTLEGIGNSVPAQHSTTTMPPAPPAPPQQRLEVSTDSLPEPVFDTEVIDQTPKSCL
eukprot:4171840-Amphidinium_carterae.1